MQNNATPILCLFDASGYIHRAYHALPPLTTSRGEPVHAVYGFSRMVAKVLKTEKPAFVGVCFDAPHPTFRHEIYTDYKGTRAEIEDSLLTQLPMVEELARAWGLPCFKKEGFEADDLIATLARFGRDQGLEVLILSGDKDVFQLVDDHVKVRDEIRKVDYDAARVQARFGIAPVQLVDYFSLMGDKVDNVPGVPGVGEKTAAKLIAESGSLENLFAHINGTKPNLRDKLLQYKERVLGNRQLIRLKNDIPLELTLNDLKPATPNPGVLSSLLRRLEFKGELLGPGVEGSVSSEINTRRRIHIVWDESGFAQLGEELGRADKISYDTETDSTDPHHCKLVGLALAFRENEAWYIPLGHDYDGLPPQLSWNKILNILKPPFENPSVLKLGQNVKFDNTILRRHGLNPQGDIFDTMIAAYCLNPSRPSFGLKDMASEFLNERMTRYEEVVGKPKSVTIDKIPVEKVAPYAAADAEVVIRLYSHFSALLQEHHLEDLFKNVEMPLVRILEKMETAGIRLDVPYLENVRTDFARQRKLIEREIYELAGEEFMLNSPQQLSRVLFEKLKLPAFKKTKTGYSTNEEVLKRLADQHPICEKIIAYRELAKLSSTYVDSLLEMRNPNTDRVHTSFHQTGTATGRLSSSDPNLQNIPVRSEMGRQIRRAFVASPGSALVSADYSQIDLRSLAHMSQDPVLCETFRKGGDIHVATAAEVFHVPFDQVTKEMRRRAKAINFGVVYGQQAWGLSQSLNIEIGEAEEFIRHYFERYAGVKSWIDQTLEAARKTGYVETLLGRRRPVEEINSGHPSLRGFAERVAINTPIQGTSADIIKMAMIRVGNEIQTNHLKTEMLVQVHDELVFDVPQDEFDRVISLVKTGMEQAFQLRVPLVVDVKYGSNWNEMVELKAVAA